MPFLKKQIIDLMIHEHVRHERVLAERTGANLRIVKDLLRDIRDEWREDIQELFDLHMSRQLAEIDAMKAAVFDLAIGRHTVTVPDPNNPKKTKTVKLPVNLRAVETMLKLMEREARLMGLDRQPLPPALTPPNGDGTTGRTDLSMLSDAELLAIRVVRLKIDGATVPAPTAAPPPSVTDLVPTAQGTYASSTNGAASGR